MFITDAVNDLMSAHSLISAPPKSKIFEMSVASLYNKRPKN